MDVNELRDKCRTCRYLSLNEGNWSSGYCWQTDKPVALKNYADFPKQHDPGCREVHGEESVWEPTTLLKPYFECGGDAE